MTNLLYAVGTGLGHLVRARAFAHGHGIPLHVFTTHPHASMVLGAVPHTVVPDALRQDGAALRAALDQTIATQQAQQVILDVFPAGIRGELRGFTPPNGTVSLLARRLRTPPDDGGPPIATAYLCEHLDDWQHQWLTQRSVHQVPARLVDPPATLPSALDRWLDDAQGPLWAVVHSGPQAELELLIHHARDDAFARGQSPTLLVIHPSSAPIPGATTLNIHPAWPLFSRVDRVVGGAGFNLVRQCLAAGVDFLPIPLPRRFDDQPGRARAFRHSHTSGNRPALGRRPPH
ncbi:MAG: hypothetical protein CL927_11885 [Deltaproteobacteria bacterium]|nr:hypothetical protein [Deltaproteobacteria bacterium]HCH62229.1 hypothetical protein [Deltaproteobacteria bacterium]